MGNKWVSWVFKSHEYKEVKMLNFQGFDAYSSSFLTQFFL